MSETVGALGRRAAGAHLGPALGSGPPPASRIRRRRIRRTHRADGEGAKRTAASKPRHIHLTPRGRFVVAVVAVVAALALVGLLTSRPSGPAGDRPEPAARQTVVVQPGQTLWSIARGLAPGRDVRETVHEIRQINGLDNAMVRSGQILVLPAR